MILAFVLPPLGSKVCFVRLLPLPRIFVLSTSPSLSRTTYIYSSSSPDSREEGSWRRLELWDLSLNFTFASLRWKKKSACHCTCILQVVVRIFYRSGIHLLRVLKKIYMRSKRLQRDLAQMMRRYAVFWGIREQSPYFHIGHDFYPNFPFPLHRDFDLYLGPRISIFVGKK